MIYDFFQIAGIDRLCMWAPTGSCHLTRDPWYPMYQKNNDLLSCKNMCSDQNVAKCLIPFHVFTGCDSNSCFYGLGKLSLFARMAKSAEARSLLLKCGESIQFSDDALIDLKIHVMRYVYGGDVRNSSLDVSRVEKWRCQKKKSLIRLLRSTSRVPTSWCTYSVILSLESIRLPSAVAERW